MNLIQQSHRNLRPLVFVVVLLLIVLVLLFYQNKGGLVVLFATPNADPISEFAGKYYMGDRLGLNCSFEISRNSSFYITWSTDTGHVANYKGSLAFEGGQLVLTPIEEIEPTVICFHRTFIPVYWGARMYLLPNDDDEISKYLASTFCKNVKSGNEPRDEIRGASYLRISDIAIKVSGFPVRQDGRLHCPRFAYAQ